MFKALIVIRNIRDLTPQIKNNISVRKKCYYNWYSDYELINYNNYKNNIDLYIVYYNIFCMCQLLGPKSQNGNG